MSGRRRTLDRAQLAAVAAAVADAEGLQAVTLARVAAELGVRPPSLYNHVASRDDLLTEVAVAAIGELADELALATAGRARRDAVEGLALAYRDYAHRHPGRYAAGLRAPAPGEQALGVAAGRLLAVVEAALTGFALGEERRVHVVRALRSALHGFVALEAAGGFALPTDRDASFNALITLFLDGLESTTRPGLPAG